MKALVIGLALAFTLSAPAMATEEPAYTVSLKSGSMEVRDYPALIAAEVTVAGDRGRAGNAAFRKFLRRGP